MDSASANTAGSELSPGFILGGGRYTLEAPVAWNPRQLIWQAQDERLSEKVALWFLPAETREQASLMDSLRRGLKNARRLSHAHILRVHDFWSADGQVFAVTEHVEAESVLQWLNAPGRTLARWKLLGPLFRQLCAALAYAHQNRIVHGSLTPENLLVNQHGQLKVAGFGLSSIALDEARRSGSPSGVPFVSPQALRGESLREADDIFAAGAILEALLSNTANAGAEPAAIPPFILALIRDCQAENPDHRPLSAPDVLRRIEAATDNPQRGADIKQAIPDLTAHWQATDPTPTGEAVPDEATSVSVADKATSEAPAVAPSHARSAARTFDWRPVVLLVLLTPALLGLGWWLKSRDAAPASETKTFFKPATKPHRPPSSAAIPDSPVMVQDVCPTPNPTAPTPDPPKTASPSVPVATPTAPTASAAGQSWDPNVFFNGTDFRGWQGDTSFWAVEDQCLIARFSEDYRHRDALTLQWLGAEVGNFELRFQHRGDADTGILYRSHFDTNGVTGYFLKCGQKDAGQLLGLAPRTRTRSLTIAGRRVAITGVNNADWPTVLGTMTKKEAMTGLVRQNEWNDYAVIAHGNRLQHEINGQIVSDVTDGNPARALVRGSVGLFFSPRNSRTESSRFRNFSLKRLD